MQHCKRWGAIDRAVHTNNGYIIRTIETSTDRAINDRLCLQTMDFAIDDVDCDI